MKEATVFFEHWKNAGLEKVVDFRMWIVQAGSARLREKHALADGKKC